MLTSSLFPSHFFTFSLFHFEGGNIRVTASSLILHPFGSTMTWPAQVPSFPNALTIGKRSYHIFTSGNQGCSSHDGYDELYGPDDLFPAISMLNIRPTTNYFDSGGRNKVHQIIKNSNDGRRTKYTKYPSKNEKEVEQSTCNNGQTRGRWCVWQHDPEVMLHF